MTLEELKQYDGQNGEKAYIAYKGKVYDVTESPLWKNGIHQNMHRAGQDLTEVLKNAPHGEEVFARFEVVGTLDQGQRQDKSDKHIEKSFDWVAWYRKYHPHPMLVHFPIALHLFAAGADLIFLFHPTAAFAAAVFYTFFVATVMGAVAMLPGLLSWKINYNLTLAPVFIIKITVSLLTLILGIIGIFVYLNDPEMVYGTSFESMLYHGIVLLTGLAVIILGYYGGKITWPDRES